MLPFGFDAARTSATIDQFGWTQSSLLMLIMALSRWVVNSIQTSRYSIIYDRPWKTIFLSSQIVWIVRGSWLLALTLTVIQQYITPCCT